LPKTLEGSPAVFILKTQYLVFYKFF